MRLTFVCVVLVLHFVSLRPATAASWNINSPLHTARRYHTATLLQNGKVLVAGGELMTGYYLSSAELFDPATGKWTETEPMQVARTGHAATLLPNGKVMVVGGVGTNGTYLSNAELYDPVAGKWTMTASMSHVRWFHTTTLLTDGKVLVAGGNFWVPEASSEIYDAATQTWTNTGSLSHGRVLHSATRLGNGKVFVVGGYNSGSPIGEIYDPATGTWTNTAAMTLGRFSHTATPLANGQVLVAGGVDSGFQFHSSAALYDPVGETWETIVPMITNHAAHTANVLPNGKVLVIGGTASSTNTDQAELFDPSAKTWSPTSPMAAAHMYHTATQLPGGRVLVAAGNDANGNASDHTELYDLATGTWTPTSSMTATRWHHTTTLLPNGLVLVAGGLTNFSVSTSRSIVAELYNPSNITWTAVDPMARDRAYHTATLLPNGNVLLAGGVDQATAELFNSLTRQWSDTGAMKQARRYHTATLLFNGKVLVTGGVGIRSGATSSLSTCELYNPVTGEWVATGEMNNWRAIHTANLLSNGRVLVVGGYDDSSYPHALPTAELYDPATGMWTLTGNLNIARNRHAATLLPNGKLLVTGGEGNSFPYTLGNGELFDPATGIWTLTGNLITPRQDHTSSLLANGMVLLAAGHGEGTFGNTGTTSAAELYDPATAKSASTGNLVVKRYSHTATLLSNGKVLITGGLGNGILSDSEEYDIGLGFSSLWQPPIASSTSPLGLGSNWVFISNWLRGVSGASGGNSQDSSSDYPLVQLRSLESGQTMFLQTTNWSTNSFTSLPVWNFPPGWAMAIVFVNGIPSTSSIVNIAVPTPVATTVTAIGRLTNGTVQFAFTNNPGAVFGVLATTNLSLPVSNWTALGGVTENSPGQFWFTDPQASTNAQRFYRLRAP